MESTATELDLSDYLRALRRRKYHFLIPFALSMIVALLLAFLLPTRYRSEATLLIERQSIPSGIVESTVTGFVQEHIQLITQQILTFDNLSELAEKYDLYSALRSRDSQEAIKQLGKDFTIEMLDVKASDPNQAGTREATIAFKISFTASSAKVAQAVTQELADRYLKENEKHRLSQSRRVSKFLEEEAAKIGSEIEVMEKELAVFKQGELNNLPEVMALNRSLYEKTESNIDNSRDRIRELENRIDSVNSELAVVPMFKDLRTEDGGDILNAQDRMNGLVAQYVRATSRYSARHPDVIRLAREIRTLAEQTGTGGRADELMSELIRQQEALRQAEQKYGSSHPDVLQLQRAVSALESSFHKALIPDDGGESSSAKADNPAFVALRSQLESAQSSLTGERSKLLRFEQKLEEYEARLIESPEVESRYSTLSRELQSNVSKYNELKDKQLRARLSQELESGDAGEKFSLASSAFLPNLPDSPNRLGILLLGLLVAAVLGVSAVALAEFLDNAVYDVRAVTNIFGVPPLAVIPRITHRLGAGS